jgi:hypothetical protein
MTDRYCHPTLGRRLYATDIVALVDYRVRERWVRDHFAPHLKRKLGRTPFWWEAEATDYLTTHPHIAGDPRAKRHGGKGRNP